MPWETGSVMDRRIEFLVKAAQAQVPFAQLCAEYGISRKCGYAWRQRLEEAGSFQALAERSRRPHHSPNETPEDLVAAVLEVRERYGWGGRKIAAQLRAQGLAMQEWTANRILKRRGQIARPCIVGTAVRRFARAEPNQLHQMDFKGEYVLTRGKCYPLAVLDDHSRYLLGLWALPDQRTETVQAVLERLFGEVGVPQAMLMDHGPPWWSNQNGHGLTRLSVWLLEQGVRLRYSGVRHPQTQGKLERCHRSLGERTRHAGLPQDLQAWQAWVPQFRQEYNEIRPHEALHLRTPSEVWRPVNLRPYQDPPPPYDYGEAQLATVDQGGFLSWKGCRYFVCEALTGKRVRLDFLGQLLVVSFRDTTVREIDLRTGRTSALVLPVRTARVSPMSC